MLERPPGGTTIRLPAGLTGASSGPMTGHTERGLREVTGLITVKVRSWAKSARFNRNLRAEKFPTLMSHCHTCVQVVHVNLRRRPTAARFEFKVPSV